MRKLSLLLVALAMTACVSFQVPEQGGTVEPMSSPRFEQDDAPPPRSKTADVIEQVLPSLVNVKVRGFSAAGETQGEGSGVVIDPDGIIVTNNHVVQDAVQVRVIFTDDSEPVEGTVIGTVPDRDLAVITVSRTGLTPIKIGSSANLRLGDDVIALGYPLGLGGPTVTKGIVSGTNRSLRIPRAGDEPLQFRGLLQTDAAINPGNSGGPLVDSAGRLVGIDTAAAGASAAENVGFAIAIDSALPVVEEILSEPADERAWLGVLVSEVDASVAAELGLDPDQTGVLITQIVPDAPADTAGLEEGDVIVAIEGQDIETFDDLTRVLSRFDPGETISVEIVTAEGSDQVQVELEQRPVPAEE